VALGWRGCGWIAAAALWVEPPGPLSGNPSDLAMNCAGGAILHAWSLSLIAPGAAGWPQGGRGQCPLVAHCLHAKTTPSPRKLFWPPAAPGGVAGSCRGSEPDLDRFSLGRANAKRTPGLAGGPGSAAAGGDDPLLAWWGYAQLRSGFSRKRTASIPAGRWQQALGSGPRAGCAWGEEEIGDPHRHPPLGRSGAGRCSPRPGPAWS